MEAATHNIIRTKLNGVLELNAEEASALLSSVGLEEHICLLPLHTTSAAMLRGVDVADAYERDIEELEERDATRKRKYLGKNSDGADVILFHLLDGSKLKELIGSQSQLHERKLRRAALQLLEPPNASHFDPSSLGNPAKWSVDDVCAFVQILGLDPAPFAALPVVGEDMAFIDDDEFDEVGITAGLARQRFLFNVHRCLLVEEEDGGEEDAGRGGGAAGGGARLSTSSSWYMGKFGLRATIPLGDFDVESVCALALALDLDVERFRKLALNGLDLIELEPADFRDELKLEAEEQERLEKARRELLRPPEMSLGKSDYFSVRVAPVWKPPRRSTAVGTADRA